MTFNTSIFSCLIIAGLLVACSSEQQNPAESMTNIEDGQVKPIPLPPNFDPAVNMLGKQVNGETFHGPRASIRFCEKLLANGTPEDIANVEKMIPGVLSGQELDPESPHVGGFRWEIEMEVVEDLNAVQFLLHSMIPILLDHADKLKPGTVTAMKESIYLGLKNIEKIDVNLQYTNIVLKDINNSCLGGELLEDDAIAQRGYEKFRRWVDYTNLSGGLYEFNSTPYTAVAIEVLERLSRYVKHPPTKLAAKMMLWRVGLSAGLHMHANTQRWTGPYGRAYHGSTTGVKASYFLDTLEKQSFDAWTKNGKMPAWMAGLTSKEMLFDQVDETVGRAEGIMTSVYKGKSYDFGIASRNLSNQANRYIAWQTNPYMIHYERPGKPLPGSIYTKFLLNDHWLGYFSAGIGRAKTGLVPDEGLFQGVLDQNRAIALYVPQNMGALDHYSSAKTALAVNEWDGTVDEIWVGDQQITQWPHEVAPGDVLVIKTGSILLGVRPFALTKLGKKAPIQIDLYEDGTLVIEMYNYTGPAKTFWELAWPGTFYQGQPHNGFYSEIAEASDYDSPSAFAKEIANGSIIDEGDERSTYTGVEEQKWRVAYSRTGKTLGMEVDMFDWARPPKRWTAAGEIPFPMLSSKYAVQSADGKLTLQDVKVSCAEAPAWLYRSADGQTVVVAVDSAEPADFALTSNAISVTIASISRGYVLIENGQVTIEGMDIIEAPILKGAQLKKLKKVENE